MGPYAGGAGDLEGLGWGQGYGQIQGYDQGLMIDERTFERPLAVFSSCTELQVASPSQTSGTESKRSVIGVTVEPA